RVILIGRKAPLLACPGSFRGSRSLSADLPTPHSLVPKLCLGPHHPKLPLLGAGLPTLPYRSTAGLPPWSPSPRAPTRSRSAASISTNTAAQSPRTFCRNSRIVGYHG